MVVVVMRVMSTAGRARTGRVVRQRLQEGLLLLSGADRDRLLLLMEVMRKKLMGVMVLTARGGGVRRQGRTGCGGGVVVVHALVRRLGRLAVSSVKSAAAVFACSRQRRTGRTGTGHAALGHR